MLNTDRFEEFISQYPIYEYRLVDTAEIEVRERVRIICKQECERYGTTWACPPAVGSLEECGKRIHSYPNGILFSSVAEVSDILNMEELALWLIEHLRTNYSGLLEKRYGISEEGTAVEILGKIARARGCLKKGEELDYVKASGLLFDDFRGGKIGRVTLEWAEQEKSE